MTSRRATYVLHGLNVRSEYELDVPTTEHPADLSVRDGGDRALPLAPPVGTPVAQLGVAGAGYAAAEHDGEIVVRFFGLADFVIDLDAGSVTAHRAPVSERLHPERDLVPILLESAVLSVVLGAMGHFALHASAVQHDRAAVAVVGHSGSGKTTVAALLCAAGAKLVTDDLLRVDVDGPELLCHRGTQRLRLRAGAAAVGDLMPGVQVKVTEDDRVGIAAPGMRSATSPLRAVIAPRPDRAAERLNLRRLAAREALDVLLRTPRTVWTHAETPLRAHLTGAAALAERTQVYEATIPWGPPFPDGLGAELLDAVT